MRLTKTQLNLLRRYRLMHGNNPTVAGLMWAARFRWLPLLIATGIGFLMAGTFPQPGHLLGYFIAGMCFGAVLRDVGHSRISVRLWPMMEQIVDWQRVEELVREADQPPA